MDDVTLEDVLTAMAAQLQGIRSELRALRLEQRAVLGVKMSAADTEALADALTDADEIAEAFGPCEDTPPPVRVLS